MGAIVTGGIVKGRRGLVIRWLSRYGRTEFILFGLSNFQHNQNLIKEFGASYLAV